MMTTKVGIGTLRDVSVLFPGDAYELACFLLKAYYAKDRRTHCRTRPTVNGLAKHFAWVTGIETARIEAVFRRHRLPLGAVIEWDEEAA